MPGKFEGEPAHTVHYYNLALQGDQDESVVDSADKQIDIFRIDQEDTAHFPDLIGDEFIMLWEDEQGFVYTETATSEGDLIDALESMGVDDESINDMSI